MSQLLAFEEAAIMAIRMASEALVVLADDPDRAQGLMDIAREWAEVSITLKREAPDALAPRGNQ